MMGYSPAFFPFLHLFNTEQTFEFHFFRDFSIPEAFSDNGDLKGKTYYQTGRNVLDYGA